MLINSLEEFNRKYLPETDEERQIRELTPEELGRIWAEEFWEKFLGR